jgi:hypothetical protein
MPLLLFQAQETGTFTGHPLREVADAAGDHLVIDPDEKAVYNSNLPRRFPVNPGFFQLSFLNFPMR